MMTIAIPPRPEGQGILAKKSDEDNLTEYYDIINSLFKEDSNIPEINSIRYKMVLLQEKEVKQKSVIIHI